MRVTLKDVAKKANVSLSSVSHILNDRPGCYASKATRKRVMDAVKEMNYRPNRTAQSLVSGKSNLIGLVIPAISNIFFPEIIRGIDSLLRKRGYTVILCHSNESSLQEKEEIETLLGMRVDGIIISPTFEVNKDNSIFAQLQKEKVPFVMLNGYPDDVDCNYVITDDKAAAYDGVSALVQKGHKRIAYLWGDQQSRPGIERISGYREALAHYNIPYNEDLVAQYDFSETGHSGIEKLLSLPEPPTAIIAATIIYGLDALKYAQKLKIKVPDDLTLMSFGGEELLDLVNIPMTFISQHSKDMGQQAAEIILDQIDNKTSAKKKIKIKADIVS